ncbi:BQ2448_3081 [Microbotryum intermedium]|uniref:BQ2448_3081 protein n=1 Tax=Microbotryum intermedium TaxID=269621 RepID=A0A238FHM4_9BASI|nr:BQ2448_3081 [Microbotryum intermedium]
MQVFGLLLLSLFPSRHRCCSQSRAVACRGNLIARSHDHVHDHQQAPKQGLVGLVVTVAPSSSAFFAGELFECTITFANPAPPPHPNTNGATSTSSHPYESHSHSVPTSASRLLPPGRRRPPSASHLGLAEYDSRHLDSDEMPPSPFVELSRDASASWGTSIPAAGAHSRSTSVASTVRNPSSGTIGGARPSYANRPTHHKRPSFSANHNIANNLSSSQGTSSSANPNLGGFSAPPQPPWAVNHRSSSGLNMSNTLSRSASNPSGVNLPTRKGLIGKAPAPNPPPPSRGIYSNGPRRPGQGPSRSSHGRTMSMAVSSSNLFAMSNVDLTPQPSRHSTPLNGPFDHQPPTPPHERTSSLRRIDPAAPPSVSPLYDTSAQAGYIPGGDPAPRPISPEHPYLKRISSAAASAAAAASTATDRDSDEDSNYDPSDSRSTLPSHGFYGMGRNETMDNLVKQDLEAAYAREVSASQTYHLPNGSNSSVSLSNSPAPTPLRTVDGVVVPPPPRTGTVHLKRTLPGTTASVSRPTPASVSPSSPFTYPPETVSLLWSFAHLEGTFEVDEALVKPGEFTLLKQELTSGPGAVVGGGTLNDSTQGKGSRGSGWTSWIWGGGNNGASSGPDNAQTKLVGAGGGGLISQAGSLGQGPQTLEERKEKSLKEKTIPTFSSPPSILGVDLVLEPGEFKSYTFSIRIPADLPPSFRGKSIKFSYHLAVGTNWTKIGGINSMAAKFGAARNATSRVIKVPVRVYNHVGVTGARPFYDLTNPIVYHRDEATVQPVVPASEQSASVSKPALVRTTTKTETVIEAKNRRRLSIGRREFEAYATTLLDSVRLASPELVSNASLSPTLRPTRALGEVTMEGSPALRPERLDRHGSSRGVTTTGATKENGGALGMSGIVPHTGALASVGMGEEDETAGCKAAVEIVTRNSQKVSYDINKDGFMVAQLTLVKSAYRLGETVNGSVVINSSEGRVLRISARLETHELIETSITTKPAPQVRALTRRLHSEHHQMTLDCARVGFALAIPSGATPDFGTSGVKLQWSVRLSFLVVPPSPDAKPATQSQGHARRGSTFLGRGAPHAPPPPPPSGLQGGAGRSHARSKSFAYGFEPTVPLTLPAAPAILPTGAAHLMPVLGPRDTSASHVSYRAVPDLGFAPVLYSTNTPEAAPTPGPLQRTASGKALHFRSHSRSSSSLSHPRGTQVVAVQQTSVVLVPAKYEMVECSIPIKVYPGNTPFRPTLSMFAA